MLTLGLHILSQASHLGLVLLLNLVADALEFLALGGSLRVEVLVEGVLILGLSHLLLLFLNFKGAQVLFQLAFVDPVLVLSVLELDLALLLNHGLTIKILEEQVLKALPPDLNGNRVLLLQVLVLTVLVAELSLLVLFFLLGDQPEVVDSETLIVVLARGDFFSFDLALEGTSLHTERLLELIIVVVIDGVYHIINIFSATGCWRPILVRSGRHADGYRF